MKHGLFENDVQRVSRRRFVAGAAGSALLVQGCATNPATGRGSFTGAVSVEDDIKLGQQEHPKLVQQFGGIYEDRRLQGYVDRVGRQLASHAEFQQFPYQFTLLDTPIVNAFALPGGYVYISRGLLALGSNEAEMAGVLAHELGHVNARHTAERISSAQLAQIGLTAAGVLGAVLGAPSSVMQAGLQAGQQVAALSIQGHSRQQEFEADMLGVRYMSKAGYDPDAMVSFLSTLREQSILEANALGLPAGKVDEYNMMSTHPRTIDRVREAQAAAQESRPVNARLGRDDYLENIDGMLFGDDPAEGIIAGRKFRHPGLRFEFEVPPGFRLQNGSDRVIAQHADGSAMLFDIAPVERSRNMLDYVGQEWAGGGDVRGLQALRSSAGDAATGVAQAQIGQRTANVRLVGIHHQANSAFRFLFVLPQENSRNRDEEFGRTVLSFRRLSASEANAIKPLRVRVRSAGRDDRVEQLAQPLPFGERNAQWFRVINDMAPGAQPARRDMLKVISA